MEINETYTGGKLVKKWASDDVPHDEGSKSGDILWKSFHAKFPLNKFSFDDGSLLIYRFRKHKMYDWKSYLFLIISNFARFLSFCLLHEFLLRYVSNVFLIWLSFYHKRFCSIIHPAIHGVLLQTFTLLVSTRRWSLKRETDTELSVQIWCWVGLKVASQWEWTRYSQGNRNT